MITYIKPRKALNASYSKLPVLAERIEKLRTNLKTYIELGKPDESEEYHKGLIKDFLSNTWYGDDYSLNTNYREDLVIYTGKDVSANAGVIIEAKSPNNKSEMLSEKNENCKALQECVYYFMQEAITKKNSDIKKIIITNYEEWFIFEAKDFFRFFCNKANSIYDEFIKFELGQLTDTKTSYFYEKCAKPAIDKWLEKENINAVHFSIRDFYEPEQNKLSTLYKILSPENLLSKPFTNDSNSLDKNFYAELLHIIGLEEVKESGKKLIKRKEKENRNKASLLEQAIYQLEEEISDEEKCFETALRLVITWVNRLLFLKLVESQQLSYQNKNPEYSFLTIKKVQDFDELNDLFFKVLGKRIENRDEELQKKFSHVPYLNSSLFEPTEDEGILKIRGIKNRPLELFSQTVLKNDSGKKLTGEMDNLQYFFAFLDSYNFASDSSDEIQNENKTLINASVLGLIFEKINGYKDGSFFTPGFITQYMAEEAIDKVVVQKFNEIKGWKCKNLEELEEEIDDREEANEIINKVHICDPAVGSGHFLVSALNRLLFIKSYLNILLDKNGKRIKRSDWELKLENDEITVVDEDGNRFEYKATNSERQRVQEALFNEKRTIIENCLFGVDLNPNSVYICRLRLWIELLKNTYYTEQSNFTQLETLPNIDINIKCGNSLISKFPIKVGESVLSGKIGDEQSTELKKLIPQYKMAVAEYKRENNKETKRKVVEKIASIKKSIIGGDTYLFEEYFQDEILASKIFKNSMEWMIEFPEVLNDDGIFEGFDCVIGNPPYIQLQANKGFLADLYKDFKYETFFKMGDIYCLFIERGFSLLKQDGILSFINPNTWLQSISFSPFRKFVTTKFAWKKIALTNKVFDEATVDTHCVIFEKKDEKSDCEIFRVNNDSKVEFLHNVESHLICNTENVINIEINPEKRKIIEKIKANSSPFSTYFDITVGVKPFQKGKGKPAQTAETVATKPFVVEGDKPDSKWSPLMRGSLMNRYVNLWNNNYWILYGEWLAEPRNRKIFDAPEKIIIRQTGDSIIATIIESGIICRDNLYVCVPKENINLKYILGISNSKAADFYYEFLNPEKGEGLAQVKREHVAQLPIPTATPDQQNEIIALVDKILKAKKTGADTSELENQIDQKVYELYGLTEEEIKVVEEK